MIPLKDDNPSRSVPIINILLILINVLVFVYQFFFLPQGPAFLIKTYGFVPHALHHTNMLSIHSSLATAATLFSAMFIHGGGMHIIGNMLYLFIFGDNVEDRLGHLRYLVFYLLCGITAALVHAAIFPESRVPSVGASGAIAAVTGAYLVLFPNTLVTVVYWFFFIGTVEIHHFAGAVDRFANHQWFNRTHGPRRGYCLVRPYGRIRGRAGAAAGDAAQGRRT